MTTWHYAFSTPVPDDTVFLVHRVPPDTPVLEGIFNGQANPLVLVTPNLWPIPYHQLWRWRLPWQGYAFQPPPIIPDLRWRDPLVYPPADQQSCWVRLLPEDAPAVLCHFDHSILSFVAQDTFTDPIPFWRVWKWKPLS